LSIAGPPPPPAGNRACHFTGNIAEKKSFFKAEIRMTPLEIFRGGVYAIIKTDLSRKQVHPL